MKNNILYDLLYSELYLDHILIHFHCISRLVCLPLCSSIQVLIFDKKQKGLADTDNQNYFLLHSEKP
jgi:hypothetical protein